MAGEILIDARLNRIAEMDGTLAKDVGFGWGFLGHLDRGGHFWVQQGDIGDAHWEITRMDLALTGKVLLFKNINIKTSETFSHFQAVPANLTFAQGVDLLKKREAQIAENREQSGGAQPK
jgi:hypothetical protein